MSECPNWWMVPLPETIDWGVDTACSSNCHCLCLRFLSVARVPSGYVMITRASGFGMGVGRLSIPLREVGVLAMPDAGLDSTQRVESVCIVLVGAGVFWLLEPGVEVRVIIDRRCVADGVEVTRWVISAKRELFSEDEVVEFWRCIVEGTELPLWEASLSPAGTERCLLAGGSWEFPEGLRFCWFWGLAKPRPYRTTGVVSGWGLREGIFRYRCSALRR